MLLDYLKYLVRAKTLHGTHSPFIYEFYKNVFANDRKLSIFETIETYRLTQQKNKTEIAFEDFGAGANGLNRISTKSINKIAKRSLKRSKWGRAFHRAVKAYNVKSVIELGTSLGTTTAYIATANSETEVNTFEGSNAVMDQANLFFSKLGLANITTHLGNIDRSLPNFLASQKQFDLVYIDANHRLEPTLRYFELLFPHLHEDSMVVFDDIYWSSEMKQAWQAIKEDERVRQTIDLFEIGIVFFRQNQEKEHFTLRY